MAHQITVDLTILVRVFPADYQDLPKKVRGKGYVAVFNGCPPLSVPTGEKRAVDVFAAYARGNTELEAIDNLIVAIERALTQAQRGDSFTDDISLAVGDNQPALVRVDLLQIG